MSTRWSNDAVAIHTAADASTAIVISGVTETGESLNTTLVSADTGAAYPEQPTIGQVSPVITFATEMLEMIIDNIDLAGKLIDSDGTHPGFISYFAKHDPAQPNGRATGAVHGSTTFGDGQIVIESITADAGQSAIARLQVHALSSDGETSPIARAWNVTLPTWPVDDAYKLAGVIVDGTLVETIRSMTINYNAQSEKPITGSFRYPVLYDPVKVAPSITLTFDDPQEILDSILGGGDVQITEEGKRLTSTSTALQFRRSMDIPTGTGAPFAKASLEHITCDINGFAHTPTPMGASGSASHQNTVEIVCEENAVGVPLIWTKDQAIS